MAVVQSLGATRAGIRGVFLVLGGVIGVVGTAAGLILGLATCAYVAVAGIKLPSEYYLRTLPVDVRPGEVIAVVGIALLAAFVAVVLRELTVDDLSPAEGLRND